VHKSTLKNVSPKSGSVIDTNPDLKSNLVATLPISTPIDYVQMASLQHSCTECTQMCNSTVLFVVTRKIGETLLRGDISKNFFRPLVPVSMRSAVIAAIHNVAHPGVEATVRLVTAKFCWPKMAKQIRLFSQQCIFCQRAKISTHVHLAPAVIPVPQRRFEHVHVDLVGPLPTSSGFTYLFTVVDRTTRWPEAIPLSGISAADCAAALFSGWIQRFGVPAYITSDRGAQFTSSLWTSLCSLLSITHLQTTAYHPQSNGLVERFHRRLKDSLRARLAGADWLAHLPWVLLGVRTSVPLEGGLSPAEAVMGCQPLLPGQFLPVGEPPLEDFLDKLRENALKAPRPVSHKNTPLPTTLPPELMSSEFVLVRKDGVSPSLAQPYDGPYKVLRRSLHTFQLQIGTRIEEISTHRLKVCRTPPDTAAAIPPRRGRPQSKPPVSDGAKTPNQNPGELTSSKKHVYAGDRSPASAGNLPDTAEKTAGKNHARFGTQPALRKKQTGAPRVVVTHSNPALQSQMGERPGITKRVRFSCKVKIIPTGFSLTPPGSIRKPDPSQGSGSSRPNRIRKLPDRLGISRDPSVSRLGGEL
jgi:transposase InsO family protein